VRAEVQQQGLQELTQAVQEKCFNKCVTRPQERLDSKQQQCLSMCIERYIDTMKVVSASMMQRGQRVCSSTTCIPYLLTLPYTSLSPNVSFDPDFCRASHHGHSFCTVLLLLCPAAVTWLHIKRIRLTTNVFLSWLWLTLYYR
ncbi:hypothetical protein B5M09_012696, partial [Aphanomyces astaci]